VLSIHKLASRHFFLQVVNSLMYKCLLSLWVEIIENRCWLLYFNLCQKLVAFINTPCLILSHFFSFPLSSSNKIFRSNKVFETWFLSKNSQESPTSIKTSYIISNKYFKNVMNCSFTVFISFNKFTRLSFPNENNIKILFAYLVTCIFDINWWFFSF